MGFSRWSGAQTGGSIYGANRPVASIMRYLSDTCQRGLIQGSWLDGGSGVRPRMWSAAFSPVMIDGALRLPLVTRGKIEESATRNPSTPITRHSGSTTLMTSSARPILQVPHGWYALSA